MQAVREHDGLTVEQLSRLVGMSARNIRSHQARKLLPPPIRRGRIAVYTQSHVHRLRTIISLQRQGFNLVAIEAILGARAADPGAPALADTVQRLMVEHPWLVGPLRRHNVVAPIGDGALHVVRPQVVRAALRLNQAGLPAVATMQILAEVLDRLQAMSDDVTTRYRQRVLAEHPTPDVDTRALTQVVVDLLADAFRVAVENSAALHQGTPAM